MLRPLSLVALLALAILAPVTAAQAQDDAETAVQGRLGGTLGSFIERFGEPESVNAAAGPIFRIEGYGYVAVRATDNLPENTIRRITISSERSLDLSATEADPADWSIDDATEKLKNFLPDDIEISDFQPDDNGQISAVCQSEAIAALDEASGGACRIAYVLPTESTVSYASVTLIAPGEAAEALTPEASPCTGAVEWIAAAGRALAESQAQLNRVLEIDEADPNAVATLREIAESFRQLAAAQRGSDPPKPAGQANFYLISALTTYAKAVETAADGIEAGDSALVDEAVEGFGDAGRAIDDATAEIEAAAAECGLELGTPVPEASPAASLPNPRLA